MPGFKSIPLLIAKKFGASFCANREAFVVLDVFAVFAIVRVVPDG